MEIALWIPLRPMAKIGTMPTRREMNVLAAGAAFPRSRGVAVNTVATHGTVGIVDVKDIEQSYALNDPPRVRAYLDEHPSLIPLLLEARPEVDLRFGSDTPVTLDIVHDPEDNTECLYAVIETRLDVDEALNRLDQFNDYWWQRSAASVDLPPIFVFDYV